MIKPRALHMLGKRFTTELYPRACTNILNGVIQLCAYGNSCSFKWKTIILFQQWSLKFPPLNFPIGFLHFALIFPCFPPLLSLDTHGRCV
jgi:hypothetical protein